MRFMRLMLNFCIFSIPQEDLDSVAEVKDVSFSNHCDLVPDKQQKINGWTSPNRFIFSSTIISLHVYEIIRAVSLTR